MVRSSLLIVGLGNPGKEYEGTRHNIGSIVVQKMADQMGWSWKEERRFNGKVAKGQVEGVQFHLLFPTTYMNNSGVAVRTYMDYYHLNSDQLVVVSDDVELAFGSLRLRSEGGSGGHNGLKSITNSLGTQKYVRLRMGVGAPPENWGRREDSMADYVLSRFTLEESEQFDHFIERAEKLLMRLVHEDVQKLMNEVNRKQNIPQNRGQEKKE